MPITLPVALTAHLDQEVTTLATLWHITRKDGTNYYYTDHDEDINYQGNLYVTGVGYNRSAVEDKGDFSVDNMNVQGVLNAIDITRADVRGARFDGAEVKLTVVNYENLSSGGILRRRGWFGEVKQNNRGEFETELRGLSQALSEGLTRPYTPACPVDLGSPLCGVPLDADAAERANATLYNKGDWVSVYEAPDLVFRCILRGETATAANFDPYEFMAASPGDVVVDGNCKWQAFLPFRWAFTVVGVTSLRTFEIQVEATPVYSDPTYFDGGLISFLTGNNNDISKEVETFVDNSAGDGTVNCYLKFPFTVQVGDTGFIYPACNKSMATCVSRFSNGINFQGFPHVPGDKYLKDYPDAK